MSNFSAFMKSNKKQRQNELYAATKSLTDENGVPLLWELRAITTRENEAIREECMTEVQVPGKPGMYRPRVNMSAYQAKLMAAAVVTPDLRSRVRKSDGRICSWCSCGTSPMRSI